MIFLPSDSDNFDQYFDCYQYCHDVLQGTGYIIRQQQEQQVGSDSTEEGLRVSIRLCDEVYPLVMFKTGFTLETNPYSGRFYAAVNVKDGDGRIDLDIDRFRHEISQPRLRSGSNVVFFLNAVCHILSIEETSLFDDSHINGYVPLANVRRIAGLNTWYEDLGYQMASCRYSRAEIKAVFDVIEQITPSDRTRAVGGPEAVWFEYKDKPLRSIYKQYLKNRDSTLIPFTFLADYVINWIPEYKNLLMAISVTPYRKLTSKYDLILFCNL